ncbi:hypothetical protein MNBD_BACTEROID05-1250 [hydrothermal vent metagenome]|uniref:Sulfotransferase family protein n=1 Tax=hydrothermal vent metagenome TaxID=652676 RepID=A0A3B0T2P0_9ZZZZ
MLISHKYKFIFIHIQKTGGSSIEKALATFDRLVSWYTMIKRKGANPQVQNKFWKYILEKSRDFDSFVKNCTTTIIDVDDDPKSTVFNQWKYISDKKGNLIIDYVGRFENLTQSFKEICTKIGIKNIPLPFENKTNHNHYRHYYTKELHSIIKNRFKKDIQMFNYNFDSLGIVHKQKDESKHNSRNLSQIIFKIKKRTKETLRMIATGNVKLLAMTLEGFFSYYLLPRKNIIIILCPMRCGSTLLKALLGSAPDVSHLPETDYRSYWKNKYYFYASTCRLSKKRIIAFKQPFWLTDTREPRTFPKLKTVKIIGLYFT